MDRLEEVLCVLGGLFKLFRSINIGNVLLESLDTSLMCAT